MIKPLAANLTDKSNKAINMFKLRNTEFYQLVLLWQGRIIPEWP